MPVVVADDFNAKHHCWSSPVNDTKDKALADMTQSLDLVLGNHGPSATREKDGHRSYIDVTLVSASLQALMEGWAVLQLESLSDHNYIKYAVGTSVVVRQSPRGWSTRHLNREKLLASLTGWEFIVEGTAEEYAQDLVGALTPAMECSAPKRSSAASNRKSVHWWYPEIGTLRTQSNYLRRTYQRNKRRGMECQDYREAARAAKLRLVTAIKRAKEAAWAELCMMVNTDPQTSPGVAASGTSSTSHKRGGGRNSKTDTEQQGAGT